MICPAPALRRIPKCPALHTLRIPLTNICYNYRSESDARTLPVTNTISVFNASPRESPVRIINPNHIHTVSSNKILFQSSTEIGVPTKNCCYWKERKSTAWDHGPTLPTILAASAIRMRCEIITTKPTSNLLVSRCRNDAVLTIWTSPTKFLGKTSKPRRSEG